MISDEVCSVVQQKLTTAAGTSNKDLKFSRVGGGSINECYKIVSDHQSFFCKINSASKFPRLFEKEKAGLESISNQKVINTPAVIDCFEVAGKQVLLMEWIEEGARTKDFWKKFGEQLAALHRVRGDRYGFGENNYMGSVAQNNEATEHWVDFFINRRLEPLVTTCRDNRLLQQEHVSKFEGLYKKLGSIFPGTNTPVLLHGDLWSGNFICSKKELPVLIDPAVYFGHPSVDLAMTTLFGGFDSTFYESYNYHSPFENNYEQQWTAYNLYPLLIHLLLFGSGYLQQIEAGLDAFA